MKKLLTLSIILFCANLLYADLEINIPFDPNVVGPPYTDSTYIFTSDYFYVINNGQTDTFTVNVETQDMPSGWSMIWCHELNGSGACHMLGWPWEFEFVSGDTLNLDFSITVSSTGSFTFQFIFESPSISEPDTINFSYTTENSIDDINIPLTCNLSQNYPNPFTVSTTISFFNTKTTKPTKIKIYNVKGQKVRVFPINQFTSQPVNQIVWDGTDENGRRLTNGIYFYSLKVGSYQETKKMLLLR